MAVLHSGLEALRELFAVGGVVLWAILGATLLLWTLIVERYLFLYERYPVWVQQVVEAWQARVERLSWQAKQTRRLQLAEATYQLRRTLPMIRSVTAVLPLLGLLGTVRGMIYTFTVMTTFGTGNAREMASGISEALITTLAGLISALPGLYFSASLNHRAELQLNLLADQLRME